MKIMLTRIFVALGIVFLMLIIVGVYFFVTDPYNLKPLLFGVSETTVESGGAVFSEEADTTNQVDTGSDAVSVPTSAASSQFTLSPDQRQALISLGVDPSVVPTTVSVSMEACFVSALGAARVTEIKAGAVPSAFEFIKAKSCVE